MIRRLLVSIVAGVLALPGTLAAEEMDLARASQEFNNPITKFTLFIVENDTVFLDGRIMNQPEVFVGAAHTKFDDDGNLTDEPTLEFVDKFLNAFAAWIVKVGE